MLHIPAYSWLSEVESRGTRVVFHGLNQEDVAFLLEAFSSVQDLSDFMRENHLHYLVSGGGRITFKDAVEFLYKEYGED